MVEDQCQTSCVYIQDCSWIGKYDDFKVFRNGIDDAVGQIYIPITGKS